MALSSQTSQNTLDNECECLIYSGEQTAVSEIASSYLVAHYEYRSQKIHRGETLNAAGNDPDSKTTHDSSSNLYGGNRKIDDRDTPLPYRAIQNIPSGSGVRSLTPLMEWEGSVEAIEGNEFVARLTNITTGELLPTEEARFPISELNDIHRHRLEVGAIFRWVIGLQRLPNGNKQRVSELFFRKLPAHSKAEIDATLERYRIQLDAMEWDDTPSS